MPTFGQPTFGQALPGLTFYLPALVISPLVITFLRHVRKLPSAALFFLSIVIPPLLIAMSSGLAFKVLPASPDLHDLGKVFGPALAGAGLYGAALFERDFRRCLAVFGATSIILFAYLRVSERHLFALETLGRSQQMDAEMSTLRGRVLVAGGVLAIVILFSAILRGIRRRTLPIAPDLIACLVGGFTLFLPRPCPASVQVSDLARISSPEVHGDDLYFTAEMMGSAGGLAENPITYLLRQHKGQEALDCLWPCKAGLSGPSADRGDHPRFVVREQRWWYLLLGSQTAERILDARTGGRDTVFRDRLESYAERPRKHGYSGRLILGPGRSWVMVSEGDLSGRLIDGRHFDVPGRFNLAAPWLQGRKLRVLSRLDDTPAASNPILTTVDLGDGATTQRQLPLPVRLAELSPASDGALLWKYGSERSRRYWLDDRDDLVLLDPDPPARGDRALVVWPEHGKPRLVRPKESPSWPTLSCRVVAGQCLGVRGVGANPTPDRYPSLFRIDIESGAYEWIASYSGSLQWLDDSIVFASVSFRQAGSDAKALRRIVRYWPSESRTQVLLSLPEQDSSKSDVSGPSSGQRSYGSAH